MEVISWHSIEAARVVKDLNTDPHQRLSEEEVRTRLQKYGYNELKKGKGILPLTLFINQFKNLLIIILLIAVAIAKEMGISRESDMVITGDELEKWACVGAPVPFQGCPLISKALSLLAPRGLFIYLRIPCYLFTIGDNKGPWRGGK